MPHQVDLGDGGPRVEPEQQGLESFQNCIQAVGEPDRVVSRQQDLEALSREVAERRWRGARRQRFVQPVVGNLALRGPRVVRLVIPEVLAAMVASSASKQLPRTLNGRGTGARACALAIIGTAEVVGLGHMPLPTAVAIMVEALGLGHAPLP